MQPTPGRNRYASLSSPDRNATTSTSTKNKAVSPITQQSLPKKPKQSTGKSPPLSPLSNNQLPDNNDIDMNLTSGATHSPPNTQLGTKAISSSGATSFYSDMQPIKPVTFGPNYTGPLHLIISSTVNQNIGNLHPVKLGKLFISNFKGVTNVMPIGSQRVKISFDSIINANACLCSPWLQVNNYSATIPSSLIYSLGVIRLDPCISDDDFREGLECCYEVVEFRRINIKRENILVPTKLVEIKFLSPKLPDNLNLASVLHSEECSFALLSETWLRPGQKFSFPHFNLVRSDRLDGYGGVAIAAHQSIHIKTLPIDNLLKNNLLCQSIDLVGIEAFINSNYSLFLWSLYIPPSSNPSTALLNSIFQLIGTNSILGGDVNGHHPTWDNNNNLNHRGDSIYNTFSNLNLYCLNSGAATRVNRPPFANTAVDITITTNSLYWSLSWHPLEEPHGSDHFPLIIEHHAPSTLPRAVSNHVSTPPKLNYSKADWSLFSSHLDLLINSFVFSNSPLDNYDNFVHILNSAANIAIPTKRISSKYPTTSPIWWNSTCTEAIKQRSAAFKKYRTSGSSLGALSSSPLASLEVECACPPIELRSRRLAGKFLLKTLSSPNQSLFQMFVSIKSSWSYVAKSLPILASVAFSFSAFSPLVYRPSLRLQIYDTPYAALSFFPEEVKTLTVDLGTLPRCVMFLLAFSLAILILCLGAIIQVSDDRWILMIGKIHVQFSVQSFKQFSLKRDYGSHVLRSASVVGQQSI
ncbi:hypothetical protein ACI65C_007148 [Semiaphis heraclei]